MLKRWNFLKTGFYEGINLVLSNWFRSHPERDRYELCDPLAVAAAIWPDLLQYKTARVAVETKDAVRLGKTVAEYGSGHVRVAVGVDIGRAKGLIMRLLT